MYSQLSEREEFLGKEIVDVAFKAHKELGPGLLEIIYETCFCYELELKGIPFTRQADLPVSYKGHKEHKGYFCEIRKLRRNFPLCSSYTAQGVN